MRLRIVSLIFILAGWVPTARADQDSPTNVMSVSATASGSNDRPGQPLLPQLLEITKPWYKGAETNGLSCGVFIDRRSQHEGAPPICHVNIINTTTNLISGCLYLPSEAIIQIELYDSAGQPVKKTPAGNQFGTQWSQSQMRTWLDKRVESRSHNNFIRIFPQIYFPICELSLPTLFELKSAGDYSLRLSLCLDRVYRDEHKNLSFEKIPIPPVSAQVHVLSEDVVPKTSSSGSQTNSSSK